MSAHVCVVLGPPIVQPVQTHQEHSSRSLAHRLAHLFSTSPSLHRTCRFERIEPTSYICHHRHLLKYFSQHSSRPNYSTMSQPPPTTLQLTQIKIFPTKVALISDHPNFLTDIFPPRFGFQSLGLEFQFDIPVHVTTNHQRKMAPNRNSVIGKLILQSMCTSTLLRHFIFATPSCSILSNSTPYQTHTSGPTGTADHAMSLRLCKIRTCHDLR